MSRKTVEKTFIFFASLVAGYVVASYSKLYIYSFIGFLVGVTLFILFTYRPDFIILSFISIRPGIENIAKGGAKLGSESYLNPLAAFAMLLVLFAIVFLLLKKINLVSDTPVRIFFLYILISLLWGGIYSVSKPNFIATFTRLLSYFSLFVLSSILFGRSEKDTKKLVVAYFLSFVIPLSIGFYQIVTHQGRTAEWVESLIGLRRIYGTLSHPNAFSRLILFALLLIFNLLFITKKVRYKIVGCFVIGLLLLEVFHTYTRGTWLAIPLSFGIIGLVHYRKLLAIIPLFIAGVIFFVPTVLYRFSDIISVAYRWKVWTTILSYMGGIEFLFGKGLGSISAMIHTIFPITQAHNDYLRIIFDSGFVGFILYMSIHLILLYRAIRLLRIPLSSFNVAIVLTFVSFSSSLLLVSFFDNIFRAIVIQWYYWTLAGVVNQLYINHFKEKNVREAY
jgi:O-antigen ligase